MHACPIATRPTTSPCPGTTGKRHHSLCQSSSLHASKASFRNTRAWSLGRLAAFCKPRVGCKHQVWQVRPIFPAPLSWLVCCKCAADLASTTGMHLEVVQGLGCRYLKCNVPKPPYMSQIVNLFEIMEDHPCHRENHHDCLYSPFSSIDPALLVRTD